jgi:glycosyltransferase involved in cell wall biosynthesis
MDGRWYIRCADKSHFRNEYLDRIRHARVAMLLPHYQDGSFILSEAMALDVPVVCVRARRSQLCHHEKTALLVERDTGALVRAALRLSVDFKLCSIMRANAQAMARTFTLERERAAFLPVLAQALAA